MKNKRIFKSLGEVTLAYSDDVSADKAFCQTFPEKESLWNFEAVFL